MARIRRGETWWADLPEPPARSAGLKRDSVVNVSQLLTLDRGFLTEHGGLLQRSTGQLHGQPGG